MANFDVKETTIGGRQYTLPVLSGIKGRKILLTLTRVMGPLSGAASGQPVGEVIVAVLERMDDATFERLLSMLVQGAMVSGDEPETMLRLALDDTQNMVWHDNEGYLALMDFVRWALEINFGGFIAGLKARAAEAKKRSAAAKAAKDAAESGSPSQ